MKKIIFSIVLGLCFAFPSVAQNWDDNDPVDDGADAYSSRRGIYLLPEYGDFALGIDATPFLTYLGGLLSSTSGRSAPTINQTTIYGKYFLDDTHAIRAKLYLQMDHTSDKNTVANDYEISANPLNDLATVVDVRHSSSYSVGLGLGYELRRGKGRVQGFYGGEVGLGFSAGKTKFDWANPMTEVNQAPSASVGRWYDAGTSSNRVTEINPGKTFYGSVGGFVGVEYFFAPQMSLGGEFSLAFRVKMAGQSETTTERWNTSINDVESRTSRDGDWTARNMNFSTSPVSGGKIYIMFHF